MINMCYAYSMAQKKKKESSKITPLVIAFVDIYLKNNRVNAGKCLLEAGFEPGAKSKGGKAKTKTENTYASMLLANEEVKKYIAKRAKQLADSAQITPEWVLSMAKKNAEKAMKGYPVYSKDGNELYTRVDSSGVNGALSIISKILGLEKTAVEHSIKNDGFGLVLHLDGSEPKKDE